MTFEMLTKKFCPNCGSENVAVAGASIEYMGGAMICKDCSYTGIFPEKEILGREMDQEKKTVKKTGGQK